MDYGNLNISRIYQKLSDMKEAVQILRQYGTQEDGIFLDNPEAVRSARYTFIVLVEAATNIASHICARLLARAPVNYAESFLLLGEHKIMEANLAKRLSMMAGFRNLLVHGYGEIDDSRMLKIIREDLGDVGLYLAAIGELLSKAEGELNK